MKNLVSYITEASNSFRPVNWPSSRFTWIADYCKQYIKDNSGKDGNGWVEVLMKYCQGLAKGWGIMSVKQPEKLTLGEIKFIYDLCKQHAEDSDLTKPRKSKIDKTIKDIEEYFKWKNTSADDVRSILELTGDEYRNQLQGKKR